MGDDATNLPKVGSSEFDNTLARRVRKILVNHFAVLCHLRYTEFNKVIFVDESNELLDEDFVFKLYPQKYDKHWKIVHH